MEGVKGTFELMKPLQNIGFWNDVAVPSPSTQDFDLTGEGVLHLHQNLLLEQLCNRLYPQSRTHKVARCKMDFLGQ